MTDIVERLRSQSLYEPDEADKLCNEAATEIERLRSGGCARDQGTTQYCAESAALARDLDSYMKIANAEAEEAARLRAALASIDELFTEAAQDDCEHGVKWLNERAAQRYLSGYPHTIAAISYAHKVARAALAQPAQKEE